MASFVFRAPEIYIARHTPFKSAFSRKDIPETLPPREFKNPRFSSAVSSLMPKESPHLQSSSSTADGIFSIFALPIEIRYEIFKRVFALSDPLYLFQDSGKPVRSSLPPGKCKPHAWLDLLYTSQETSREARAILYGTNCFTIEEVEITGYRSNILKSFLNGIGKYNAGFLAHLQISFPATTVEDGQLEGIRLREDAQQNLLLLREKCTRLRTLELRVHSKSSLHLITALQNHMGDAHDVLMKINDELRSIVSLNKIIINICSGSVSDSAKRTLDCLGWTVWIGGAYGAAWY